MTLERFNYELKKLNSGLNAEFKSAKSCYSVTHKDAQGKIYLLYDIPLGKFNELSRAVLGAIMKEHHISPMEKLRMIEEDEDREERLSEVRLSENIEHTTAESYDVLKRMEGERITLSDVPFHVNDKRRVKAETIN